MDKSNMDNLETHVLRLYELMQRMRADLALLTDPMDDRPVLDSVADQLLTVAEESERSTTAIAHSNEKISDIAQKFAAEIKYAGARDKFREIIKASNCIGLACEVQDAGQGRIQKVIETINQVEGTLNSLVVKVGNGRVTGVETALSGINLAKDDGHETIPMQTHKMPEESAFEKMTKK